jgi:hypothetical protein
VAYFKTSRSSPEQNHGIAEIWTRYIPNARQTLLLFRVALISELFGWNKIHGAGSSWSSWSESSLHHGATAKSRRLAPSDQFGTVNLGSCVCMLCFEWRRLHTLLCITVSITNAVLHIFLTDSHERVLNTPLLRNREIPCPNLRLKTGFADWTCS